MPKDKGDLTASAGEEDKDFEGDVRPRRLRDYIGQKNMHDQLSVFLKATFSKLEDLFAHFYYKELYQSAQLPTSVISLRGHLLQY